MGFASRVAASLLHLCGLDAFIMKNVEQYKSEALRLTGPNSELRNIRTSIRRKVAESGLFDVDRYTQEFECALEEIYQQYFSGRQVRDIFVSSQSARLYELDKCGHGAVFKEKCPN